MPLSFFIRCDVDLARSFPFSLGLCEISSAIEVSVCWTGDDGSWMFLNSAELRNAISLFFEGLRGCHSLGDISAKISERLCMEQNCTPRDL